MEVDSEESSPKEIDTATWLRQLGLECYVEAFSQENIELNSILELDDEHFKELGVTVGHRIKIRKAIADFQRTNTQSQERIEYVCKVIVVGDIGTGKTSLIQRYTKGAFDKGYKATIGVDFCLKEIKWNRDTTVNVQLWDIAGQERFANLTRMYYKEARGAFVVFDVTRDRTFEAVLKWKTDIDSKVALPNGQVIPVILLANKGDLADKNYEINLDNFCKEHGFKKWFLTSAKENFGINEATDFLIRTILENDEVKVPPSVLDIGKSKLINLKGQEKGSSSSYSCC